MTKKLLSNLLFNPEIWEKDNYENSFPFIELHRRMARPIYNIKQWKFRKKFPTEYVYREAVIILQKGGILRIGNYKILSFLKKKGFSLRNTFYYKKRYKEGKLKDMNLPEVYQLILSSEGKSGKKPKYQG